MPRPNQEANWALQEQYNPRTGNWLGDTKDILLRFLQDFFGQMPSGENSFHFESDTQNYGGTNEIQTELRIFDRTTLDTDTVGKLPAITILRGPFAYTNASMDHLRTIDGQTGKESRSDLLQGSFTLACLSRQGLEAEELALLVAKSVRYYRRHLQRAGFFRIGEHITVGVESDPGVILKGSSVPDFTMVPVTIPVFYQDSWTVEKNSELLQSIIYRVRAVIRTLDWSPLEPDAFDEEGNINEESDAVVVSAWTV
jgi:hypothetical protein